MKISGRFTKIASELKKGDEIIVEGPCGIFNFEDDKKEFVFIAGGVGITPFMSILKNQIKLNKKTDITLLYASKTKDDIIFKKYIDNIKLPGFKKIYFLSKENKHSKDYEQGYIDEKRISKYVKDPKNKEFYICGPEPMKDYIVKILKNLNVKKKNIKIESFFW